MPSYGELIAPHLYKNFKDFLQQYFESHGVIEACPMNSLADIAGSPCISMLIEPNGGLELIGTYDKINTLFFKNIAAVSPQLTSKNMVLLIMLLINTFSEILFDDIILFYIYHNKF